GDITVTPGAPSQLVVTTQPPGSVTASSGFGLTVTAEDGSGNVASSFNGTGTGALTNNPGGATLGGTLMVAAAGGVATFSALTLGKVGTGITPQASSGGLTVTTGGITVTPGAPSRLVLTAQPPDSVAAGALFSLTVTAVDSFGNVASSF